jgi:hypothetical protein
MRVNDLAIPAPLALAIRSGKLIRSAGSWQLLRGVDAYGNRLETELGSVAGTAEQMAEATALLPEQFSPDGCHGAASGTDGPAGAVDDIVDFTHLVCFAWAGDGSPFCMDYRADPGNPSVVWWDDDHWRRLAPDVQAFLALFRIQGIAPGESRC